jgi:hypothetical protein
MSKIDLSKAKIGDKFRTRDGRILTYDKESYNRGIHILYKESGMEYLFLENGNFMVGEETHQLDLVEQVFDESLDTKERDIRTNDEMRKVVEIADEEKQELQRRQDVVELAERIFFSDRGNMYIFKECVEIAENSVNIRNQYLKDGKL